MRVLCKLLLAIIIFSELASCKKYLDVTPDNIATIDYAFRNRNETENYLFTCYSTLQSGIGSVISNPGFTTSGELIFPYPTPELVIGDAGFNIIRGTQNIISPALNFWDGENQGVPLFQAIRRCNIFLENVDQPLDLPDYEKKRWVAEVKFLKAYYHYWLARMYGPIPVVRENLPIASSSDQVRVEREPIDSVFSYIVRLLDEAAAELPDVIQTEINELGRITRPIALSVKAEVLVTQASPLFNGNSDYASLKNKDGESLIPATADPEKWKRASDACKEAIDACAAAGIKFYEFIPPGNIIHASDTTLLVLKLQNTITDKWNEELIWTNNQIFNYQNMCVPRLNSIAFPNDNIRSQFSAPISTAELFYSNNGVPIGEDKTWDYTGRYALQSGDSAERYYIKQGYTTIKMHFKREPRFYATLGFDGGVWFGNGTLNDDNPLYVQAKARQPAGVRDASRNNITGYFAKKLVSYQSVYLQNSSNLNYPWPMMRLSGLYLLYAEALNELNGPTAEVYQYLDAVRERAGLDGVVDSWNNYSKTPGKPTTKEGLRDIIHQERRIELCFEAQSGWDLRRWKKLQDVLSAPLQGWDIYQEEAVNFYRPKTVFTPVFGVKDYLWPIKDNNLTINPNLVQNPNW